MTMKFILRFIFFIFLNIIFPVLRPIIKRYKLLDFITLVYPGKDRDIKSYVLFKGARYIVPTIAIVGLFVGNKEKRGITVATGFSAEEMEKDKKLTNKIISALIRFAESYGVGAVSVVGRLPGIMRRQDIEIREPLVQGDKGTLFTVTQTLKSIMEKERLSFEDTKIAVIGVGFIGQMLLKRLEEMNFSSVVAYDNNRDQILKIRKNNGSTVVSSDSPEIIEDCDIVIALSANGDDMASILSQLKEGVIVVDDTHPPLSRRYFPIIKEKDGKIYKVVLGLNGMISFPRWPNYDNRWLPGCTIESIVLSSNIEEEDFDKKAESIGFEPILIEPLGET